MLILMVSYSALCSTQSKICSPNSLLEIFKFLYLLYIPYHVKGVFMIIGAMGNMLRSFFESFLACFMEYFFKNVIKSNKNGLKCIQLNDLWRI